VDFEQSRDSKFYSELCGKKLSPSRIGRYKEVLSKAEIAAVLEVTGPLCEKLGYG
jgi:hypothetical protein